ncbi:hypothetical protein GON26_20005 [Flavobacterium sp. GA093]|uniref:Uncharacterized protein n=1 Tax=Flavobacterium hydrocarbonoxydans TaxID=2683249 RepID=A0A6I4P0H6_9FLAO|nr:hypothetical protein [Flavobacterium hydrocarbonoxydans]MWB96654.1 hypothetical protein [Flavobacterium hydrocarbonoxydans]
MKKITQISLIIGIALLVISCKNTKQKLQEYVTTYNSQAATFKAANVTLTTARGYMDDNKIELRFETNLEQNESNKAAADTNFSELLTNRIEKDIVFQELVEEGVQFDVYYLADDNTVLDKKIINKEEIAAFLKK